MSSEPDSQRRRSSILDHADHVGSLRCFAMGSKTLDRYGLRARVVVKGVFGGPLVSGVGGM